MNAAPARGGKLADDAATPTEFEGEIREFIRHDVAHLRRPQAEASGEAVNSIQSCSTAFPAPRSPKSMR